VGFDAERRLVPRLKKAINQLFVELLPRCFEQWCRPVSGI
jgi:hypothetical protein